MKNVKNILILVVVVFSMSACSITRPYAVTNNELGSSTGVSKSVLIFGSSTGSNLQTALFSTNPKFGVIDAAENGKLDRVGCVDVKTSTYLGGLIVMVEVHATGTRDGEETKTSTTKTKKKK